MKKKIFMACAALVVLAAAMIGLKAYNYSQMSDLALANIEALSQNEADDAFYKIAKYNICQLFKVVKVKGSTGVSIGAILTQAEFEAYVKGDIECELVNCHKRLCLRTTEKQPIECRAEDENFVACHKDCNHKDNQI